MGGRAPLQVTTTLIEIVKFNLDEDDVDFVVNNSSSETTLSADEILATADMVDKELERLSPVTVKTCKRGAVIAMINAEIKTAGVSAPAAVIAIHV